MTCFGEAKAVAKKTKGHAILCPLAKEQILPLVIHLWVSLFPLQNVSKLLGDTIETVEKRYAEFVRELRERVRRMMESDSSGLLAFAEQLTDSASGENLARLSAKRQQPQ